MSRPVDVKVAQLYEALDRLGCVAVAVSGGVDSLTLAVLAHRRLGANAAMYHAVSPAVPAEATARTRRYAERFGWNLALIDAGEFSDSEYVRNPVNRCFFCKSNLYSTIFRHSRKTIVSGTNLDDLSDYRPGLKAADLFRVFHPYVATGVGKKLVRAIAAALDLDDIAELPASPCLSSRLETGIPVDAQTLEFVHAVEMLIGESLRARTVRCRIRRDGPVIELDETSCERVLSEEFEALRERIESLALVHGYLDSPRFERYRMGSAFLRD